ncbi:outer membrane lipoprotein chaperone LolA [Candidatus Venteria ishoeyi]|uniref:Outer-membrane lipoprotein carrier protein n=1 Tax=Candidatus Venteria ishoeyi TaxID=1899563 RepID=A0A1H6F692_9GAMM|nr:outer membrane lipoprotein chaperone LolA [Candidatus Venteria ishoeyi]MDM8548099.1 outer membrane lipoprotein chaperone LolA [Candidatus Venteria ishoeyi]SEH05698.1 Outer-membrane lipoprotein carrier protein precursor [Candidatus Venteria ishoeyi]
MNKTSLFRFCQNQCLGVVCLLCLGTTIAQAETTEVMTTNPAGLITPVQAVEATVEDNQLDYFLQKLNTLRADFKQQLFDETRTLLETSQGQLELQRPGKFRWEYQQPYEQLIVSDGSSIWIYDADLEQVTIKSFDASVADTPALLLSGRRPVDDIFKVRVLSDKENGQDLETLELLPKSDDAQFQQILLIFKADLLFRLEFKDKLGQFTLIEFSKQQKNTVLAENRFHFTPPEGTDLIDGRNP